MYCGKISSAASTLVKFDTSLALSTYVVSSAETGLSVHEPAGVVDNSYGHEIATVDHDSDIIP